MTFSVNKLLAQDGPVVELLKSIDAQIAEAETSFQEKRARIEAFDLPYDEVKERIDREYGMMRQSTESLRRHRDAVVKQVANLSAYQASKPVVYPLEA